MGLLAPDHAWDEPSSPPRARRARAPRRRRARSRPIDDLFGVIVLRPPARRRPRTGRRRERATARRRARGRVPGRAIACRQGDSRIRSPAIAERLDGREQSARASSPCPARRRRTRRRPGGACRSRSRGCRGPARPARPSRSPLPSRLPAKRALEDAAGEKRSRMSTRTQARLAAVPTAHRLGVPKAADALARRAVSPPPAIAGITTKSATCHALGDRTPGTGSFCAASGFGHTVSPGDLCGRPLPT